MQALTLILALLLTVLALVVVISGWFGPRARLWACRAGQVVGAGLTIAGWVLYFIHSGTSRHLMTLVGLSAVVIGAATLLSLSLIAGRLGASSGPEA